MRIKYLYRLFLILSFALQNSLNAYAINVGLTPKEVMPGGVFLLKIKETGHTSSVKAEFLEKKYSFHPDEDNHLIALVPVDINTQPNIYKIVINQGNQNDYVSIKVKEYKFLTKKLTLPEEKVTLSPEDQERANREAALLKNLWPLNSVRVWDGEFIAPIDTAVSEVFGVKRIMNEKKISVHRGVDYKGKTGTPIRAINSGTVVLNNDLFFGGNTLIIDHGMGLFSVYMHLSKFNASRGKKVSKEQIIGFIGSSGRATGPHLHLSVKLQGVSVNPESLFKLGL